MEHFFEYSRQYGREYMEENRSRFRVVGSKETVH
jgi:hypothetical protein